MDGVWAIDVHEEAGGSPVVAITRSQSSLFAIAALNYVARYTTMSTWSSAPS